MNIKEVRERAKMTQTELAKEMGVSQGTISQWENNKTIPDALQMLKLSWVLRCEVGELYGA